jgi:formylglycine-generating enzyme required for sulfatase activity
MELVYIPPGEFMMGSSEAEVDEALLVAKEGYVFVKPTREWYTKETPKHKVAIKKGFWMGKFEVTQAQWQSVMGNNPSYFKRCSQCPVENVSWDDARSFISELNAQNDGFNYSLPSEAEWEYSARAGTTTVFAFGNSLNSSQANFNAEYPYASTRKKINDMRKRDVIDRTVAVGSYQPNAWGLYDMHGNVSEWCQDIWNPSYKNLPTDGSANLSIGDSNEYVIRGGSWNKFAVDARSANRTSTQQSYSMFSVGFRVVARVKSQNNQKKSNHLIFSSQKDGNQEIYQLSTRTKIMR